MEWKSLYPSKEGGVEDESTGEMQRMEHGAALHSATASTP